MVPRVLEHVEERGSHFARGAERPRVESIGEHGPAAIPAAIQRASYTHEEALQAARERAPVTGLGDQVEVVRLNGELSETEAEAIVSGRERTCDRSMARSAAEARESGAKSERDVDGMACVELRPCSMRGARARAGALAAGSAACATPGPELELALTDSTKCSLHGIAPSLEPKSHALGAREFVISFAKAFANLIGHRSESRSVPRGLPVFAAQPTPEPQLEIAATDTTKRSLHRIARAPRPKRQALVARESVTSCAKAFTSLIGHRSVLRSMSCGRAVSAARTTPAPELEVALSDSMECSLHGIVPSLGLQSQRLVARESRVSFAREFRT